MAIQTGGKGRMMSEINVTPFVDVMLVLLIIFMVAAPMMVQGVNVDLPEVNAPPVDTSDEEPLIVSIDGEGQVFINDFNVGIEGLEERLVSISQNRKSMQVLLKADKNINYGMVVQAMAAIKAAGVTDLGMLTTPEVNQSPAKASD